MIFGEERRVTTELNIVAVFIKLCNQLADAEKKELQAKHGNIGFFMARSEYAPEQVHNVIFISDKIIKSIEIPKIKGIGGSFNDEK